MSSLTKKMIDELITQWGASRGTTLYPFQRDLLMSLEKMARKDIPNDFEKSWMLETMPRKYHAGIIIDEFQDKLPTLFNTSEIQRFKDERFPDADVRVYERKMGKTDPRRSNKHGDVFEYYFEVLDRKYPPDKSKTLVLLNAENLHKRLIDGAIEAYQKDAPRFGSF